MKLRSAKSARRTGSTERFDLSRVAAAAFGKLVEKLQHGTGSDWEK
jgi:hypothetical protein